MRRKPEQPISENGLLMMSRWKDPDYKKRMKESMKEKWKDPEYRYMILRSKGIDVVSKTFRDMDKARNLIKEYQRRITDLSALITKLEKEAYENYGAINMGKGEVEIKDVDPRAIKYLAKEECV